MAPLRFFLYFLLLLETESAFLLVFFSIYSQMVSLSYASHPDERESRWDTEKVEQGPL